MSKENGRERKQGVGLTRLLGGYQAKAEKPETFGHQPKQAAPANFKIPSGGSKAVPPAPPKSEKGSD